MYTSGVIDVGRSTMVGLPVGGTKTNTPAVHSRVTAGDSSVECEYKLLHQFAHSFGHRMPYTSIYLPCTTLLQGHKKCQRKENSSSPYLFAKLVGLHNL